MIFESEYSTIGEFGEVIMGMSPKGDTYNENEKGLPLLNGPTEFGSSHPAPTLYTTDSKRESMIGDLIFCVRGSTTGRMNWSNQIYSLGRGVCAIRGKTKTDTKYIKYVLDVKLNSLLNIAGGGTFPNLKKDDIGDFKIPLLKGRDKLVSIISAYDDLIENNLKRIKLLEQAAQNIYKEWFVNRRFPDNENTPIEQETGLPEGWEEKTVGDYVKIISKGPSLNYEVEKGFPVINQSCIRNGEIELEKIRIAAELKENKHYCYLKINDILINSMGQGTLGRVSKNNSISEKYIIHNCITFLRAKDIYSQVYLYQFISSKEDYFISVSQGSTGQTTLKKSLIEDLDIIIPESNLLKKYDSIVMPMWNKIGVLKNQNKKLKSARNILLPRLMNQTIEV
jgi:type I restriction enzyme S subunit